MKNRQAAGDLLETNKRLEHRIYYRIDTERLDTLLSQVVENPPNGQSPTGETGKAQPANKAKPNPPTGESPTRQDGKPGFVHTENTTEITSQNTAESSSGAGNPAPAGEGALTGEVLPDSKQEAPKDKQKTPFQIACRETWEAYSEAYHRRYGAAPLGNATVYSQVQAFVKRVGQEDSPRVAAFYVGINDGFYVRNTHAFGLMLKSAEGIHTQWVTGQSMTGTRAKQIDQSQANYSAADEAKAILMAKRASERGDHAQ
ncbi:hypothetical protein [Serratia fonticola]|uniref:hypothetical protein n=1 Tax=Serratia fonticola TaxID=47917 RepID=UPI003AAE17E6